MSAPIVDLILAEDIAEHPGRFWAWLGHPAEGGKLLCKSREPILDAARKLVGMGHDPATLMRVHGPRGPAQPDIWREPIGEAARWTIVESDRDGLVRRLWTPFSSTTRPPKDSDSEPPGTPMPPGTGIASGEAPAQERAA